MKRVRRPTPPKVARLLCPCDAGLPKLSSGRCRKCAAKAAAETRAAKGSNDHATLRLADRLPKWDGERAVLVEASDALLRDLQEEALAAGGNMFVAGQQPELDRPKFDGAAQSLVSLIKAAYQLGLDRRRMEQRCRSGEGIV